MVERYLRVNPRDDDETLDDIAPVESESRSTVQAVGQRSQGCGANNEEDEGNDNADKVGQETKDDGCAEHLETDGKDH